MVQDECERSANSLPSISARRRQAAMGQGHRPDRWPSPAGRTTRRQADNARLPFQPSADLAQRVAGLRRFPWTGKGEMLVGSFSSSLDFSFLAWEGPALDASQAG